MAWGQTQARRPRLWRRGHSVGAQCVSGAFWGRGQGPAPPLLPLGAAVYCGRVGGVSLPPRRGPWPRRHSWDSECVPTWGGGAGIPPRLPDVPQRAPSPSALARAGEPRGVSPGLARGGWRRGGSSWASLGRMGGFPGAAGQRRGSPQGRGLGEARDRFQLPSPAPRALPWKLASSRAGVGAGQPGAVRSGWAGFADPAPRPQDAASVSPSVRL